MLASLLFFQLSRLESFTLGFHIGPKTLLEASFGDCLPEIVKLLIFEKSKTAVYQKFGLDPTISCSILKINTLTPVGSFVWPAEAFLSCSSEGCVPDCQW